MKLLEKKQINATVQIERKNQIDSGIFLASKVDKLREDLLNLEKQRSDFIKGSKEQLQMAIGDLQKQKDNLEFEIKEATKRLAKLREPLDEEWKQLDVLKGEVIQIKLDSETYFQSLIKERNDLAKEKEWIDTLQTTAIENENQAYKFLSKATEDRRQTKKLLSETQALKDGKEAELYIKELSLDSKEKNLKEREETLKKERLEFNKEKKLLQIKKQRIQ
jgi:hypothetical protein